jgi:hypothetical protein
VLKKDCGAVDNSPLSDAPLAHPTSLDSHASKGKRWMNVVTTTVEMEMVAFAWYILPAWYTWRPSLGEPVQQRDKQGWQRCPPSIQSLNFESKY